MSGTIILPLWIQIIIAILLLISASFTVLGALGMVRFENFFLRMHPAAIITTLGAWCVCIAGLIFFSYIETQPALYTWLIAVMLAITAPVTTLILSRTVLFRKRNEGLPSPPSLSYTIVPGDLAPRPQTSEEITEETSDI